MADPENLVLAYLRRMNEKLGRLGNDMRDMKVGVTNLEGAMVGAHRRLDPIVSHLGCIERRLDLAAAPH